MFSEIFLTEQHSQANLLDYSLDFQMVVLSYVVAAFASFVAFFLVERLVAAKTSAARTRWLVTGAFSMGAGIWSMHFVGMMAVEMKMHMEYDVALTALSAVFAMLASGFAFHFVSRQSRKTAHLLFAGAILGAGIGAMHYVGMAAMRMDAVIRYDPLWFATSIVAAVLLASFALWQMSRTVGSFEEYKGDNRFFAAAFMGFAVTLMHYIGMGATNFIQVGDATQGAMSGQGLHGSSMGIAIAVVSCLIAGVALAAATLDARQSRKLADLPGGEG